MAEPENQGQVVVEQKEEEQKEEDPNPNADPDDTPEPKSTEEPVPAEEQKVVEPGTDEKQDDPESADKPAPVEGPVEEQKEPVPAEGIESNAAPIVGQNTDSEEQVEGLDTLKKPDPAPAPTSIPDIESALELLNKIKLKEPFIFIHNTNITLYDDDGNIIKNELSF